MRATQRMDMDAEAAKFYHEAAELYRQARLFGWARLWPLAVLVVMLFGGATCWFLSMVYVFLLDRVQQ